MDDRMRRLSTWGAAAFIMADLVWGLVLAVRVPPFAGTDESYHWLRVVQIASGGLLAHRMGPHEWGGLIDLRSVRFIQYFGEHLAVHSAMRWGDAQALAKAVQAGPAQTWPGASPMSAYSPVAYAPASLAVLLARWLGADLLVQLISARVTTALVFVSGITIMAVVIPRGLRLAAIAILSLPCAIGQSATVNTDMMNLLVPALLATLCLRARLDPAYRLGRIGKSYILALGLAIGLLKLVAVPLLLVTLIIPGSQFALAGSRRRFLLLANLLPIAVALAWNMTFPVIPGLFWHSGADPGQAMQVLLQHPLVHAFRLLRSAIASLPFLWTEAYNRIGTHPGSNDMSGPVAAPWIGLAAIASLALAADASGPRTRAVTVVLTAAAVIYLGVLLMAFRVAFASPDEDSVRGIQGRYLQPAFFFLAMAVAINTWTGGRVAVRATAWAVALVNQAVTVVVEVLWYSRIWP